LAGDNYRGNNQGYCKRNRISLGAISKFINGGNVLEANRVLIEAAIKKLDFKVNGLALCETYKDYFPIGVAIPSSALDDANMREMIKKHFNSVTAEWEMKLGPIWISEDNFNFTNADKYVDFITANHMRLRGHCLIWHIEQPDWIFKDSTNPAKQVSKEVLIQRMKKYISTVVGRYKGKIQCWDVVNEAIDTTQPQNLRNTKWLEIIGPEYLELAFKFAHEADPAAKLFYNDFDTENPIKRQAIYDMVKGLKDKGVPVDGIGSQGHISLNQPPVKNIEDTVKQFSKLGLVEITELDVSVFNSGNPTAISKEVLIEQGYRYQQLMEMLKKYKNVLAGVTFWGLKDDMSWLSRGRIDAPLLFDKRFKEKYAYWGVVDASKLPVYIKTYEAADLMPVFASKTGLPWDILKKENLASRSGQPVGGFKSFYDQKNIYLWINVNDPEVTKDSVDVFIDWKNNKEDSFSKDDSRARATYHLKWSGISKSSGVRGSIRKIAGGAVMEVSIPIDWQ
jgi:endo-1,4-beta-xylanase